MIGLLLGLALVTGYVQTGTTASGTQTHIGTAACPPSLAFGTRVHLEGKGMALDVVCEDSYAAWLSPRFDVYVRHTREAFALTGYWEASLIPDEVVEGS